jgi:hypothetical protein
MKPLNGILIMLWLTVGLFTPSSAAAQKQFARGTRTRESGRRGRYVRRHVHPSLHGRDVDHEGQPGRASGTSAVGR